MVVFNEVATSSGTDSLKPNQLSTIFQLTGTESMRAEAKFNDIFTFKTDALVVLTSNFSVSTKSVENYGALRRRQITIICDKYIESREKIRSQDLQTDLEKEVNLIKKKAPFFIKAKSKILQ